MKTIGVDISGDSVWLVETVDHEITWFSKGDETILQEIKDRSPDRIITSIRGSQILTRTYRLANPHLFEKWLSENVSSVIPGLSREEVIISHHFLTTEEVLIGVVRRNRFEELISIFERQGVFPDIVDSSGLSLWYIFKNQINGNGLILEAERDSLSSLIIRQGRPYTSHYRRLGRRYLKETVDEITMIVNFHAKNSAITLDEIIITGSKAKKVASRLKKAGFNPRLSDPFDKKEIPVEFTTAYGLTLRGAEPGLDLIPLVMRHRRRDQKIEKTITKVERLAVIAASVIVLFCFLLMFPIGWQSKAKFEKIRKVSGQLTAKRSILSKVTYYGKRDYSSIISRIGATIPSGLSLETIRYEHVKGRKGDRDQFRIKGVAGDRNLVVKFISRLNHIKGLKLVNVEAEEAKEGIVIELVLAMI